MYQSAHLRASIEHALYAADRALLLGRLEGIAWSASGIVLTSVAVSAVVTWHTCECGRRLVAVAGTGRG